MYYPRCNTPFIFGFLNVFHVVNVIKKRHECQLIHNTQRVIKNGNNYHHVSIMIDFKHKTDKKNGDTVERYQDRPRLIVYATSFGHQSAGSDSLPLCYITSNGTKFVPSPKKKEREGTIIRSTPKLKHRHTEH